MVGFLEFTQIVDPPVLNMVIAVAVGALIGAERERRKGEGPSRAPAGTRTFTITSIAGAIAFTLGGILLLAVVTASVAMMAAVSYWRSYDKDPGLTTEVVLILTALLGGLCIQSPQWAAAMAVTVTVLLYGKEWLHTLVISQVSNRELNDALIFAAAAFVILPLVPDRQMGPYMALNPHTIWIVVVLVMGISAAGYVAVRLLGARFGLPLSGALSGFISSTATIGAMGSRAKQSLTHLSGCVAGAVLSTVATIVQMALVVAALSMPTLVSLSTCLLLAGVTAIVYGASFTLLALLQPTNNEAQVNSVFSLKSALLFGSILAVIMVVSAGLQAKFGELGILLAAMVAGLVDTHAAAISVASLVATGKISPQDAIVPILAGLTSNTLTKIVIAVSSGGWPFAIRVVPGLVTVALAAWVGICGVLLSN